MPTTQPSEPSRISLLPKDRHGRRVPWFVHWANGEPDFRVIGSGKVSEAVALGLCWVCGKSAGSYKAFAIGPMCGVNRVSSEPPSHRECAIYSAKLCPFLTTPGMRRRDSGLPEDVREPAGIMIRRNPGVTLIWVTKAYIINRTPEGPLFRIGVPVEVLWFARGRAATRAEVAEAIESGLPILRDAAEQGGRAAVAELDEMLAELGPLLPAV